MELADGLHYCARGYGGQAELLEAVGDKYQLTVYDGDYHTPRWFGEGITYNIFPDRFCRDKAPEQPEGEGVVELRTIVEALERHFDMRPGTPSAD